MSILKSMNIGLSGLRSSGRSMNVIGDNIANVNTVGFKGSRTNFSDVMASTRLGIGDGVSIGSVQQSFQQGALEQTENVLDMAVTGDGFFLVSGRESGRDTTYYTRAGQFGVDREGFISNFTGLRLLGYPATASGAIGTTLGELQVTDRTAPPRATTEVQQALNLDPAAPLIDRLVTPFDASDPSTYSFSSSITIYDSLGQAIPVTVYYTRTDAGEWETRTLTDGANVDGGVAGTPEELFVDTLEFDTNGLLVAGGVGTFTFDPAGATAGQTITLRFENSTQFAGDSALRTAQQDGFSFGDVVGITIDGSGRINGVFSNGQELALGQVALATFTAPEGLERTGDTLWRQTQASGDPAVGAPQTGNRGGVAAGALENSNIDLAYEFVRMIAAQRSFSASSQVISTADQMLVEVVNLKR